MNTIPAIDQESPKLWMNFVKMIILNILLYMTIYYLYENCKSPDTVALDQSPTLSDN